MRWAIRIGKIAGIDIYLHATFFLLLLLVAGQYWAQPNGWEHIIQAVVFTCLLFTIITFHEIVHALTARRFGIQTKDIVLLPIGGIARIMKMPNRPVQELLISITGPIFNIALAFLLFVIALLMRLDLQIRENWEASPLLIKLLYANLIIGIFNLIPAFPMDGGRVLRSILAFRTDYLRATEIATTVGQFIAFMFIAIGILYQVIILVAIGIFVIIGAEYEYRVAKTTIPLSTTPIRYMMALHPQLLHPNEPLKQAIFYIMQGFQKDFPVVHGDEVVGVVTSDRIKRALMMWGEEIPIKEVMHTSFLVFSPDEEADKIFTKLSEASCKAAPIIEGGKLVGFVTLDNLIEYLLLKEAVHRGQFHKRH